MGINLGNAKPEQVDLSKQAIMDDFGNISLNFEKNQKLGLSEVASIKGDVVYDKISVGLGWDPMIAPVPGSGSDFDLDASAVVIGDGKVLELCYYGRQNILNGAIASRGDNLTGKGDGDDETIDISLSSLPSVIQSVYIGVTIYDAEKQGQSFANVKSAIIRSMDATTGKEFLRYRLVEKASNATGLVFGAFHRLPNNQWEFQAIGEPFCGDVEVLMSQCLQHSVQR